MPSPAPRPAVSVIIPVYNAEKYLRECLDSVLRQSLKEIEVICVDDGSTDNSLEILQEYARKDARIKVLHQKNQFAGIARNHGMKKACGEYLLFLDADDMIAPTMLEKMQTKALNVGAEVVVCDFWEFFGANSPKNRKKEIGKSKRFWRKNCLRKKQVFSARFASKKVSVERFALAPWNKLFKRKFIESIKNEFSSTQIANDLAFTAFALFTSEKISILPEPLVFYRQAVSHSISSGRSKHWRDSIVAWKDLKQRLCSVGVYETVKKNFLHALTESISYELSLTPAIGFLNMVCEEFPEIPNSYRRRMKRKGLGITN